MHFHLGDDGKGREDLGGGKGGESCEIRELVRVWEEEGEDVRSVERSLASRVRRPSSAKRSERGLLPKGSR